MKITVLPLRRPVEQGEKPTIEMVVNALPRIGEHIKLVEPDDVEMFYEVVAVTWSNDGQPTLLAKRDCTWNELVTRLKSTNEPEIVTELIHACETLLRLSLPQDVSGMAMVEEAREIVRKAQGKIVSDLTAELPKGQKVGHRHAV